MNRKKECDDCYYLRPGAGCVSEAEMFCGCCYTKITPAQRLEQLTEILEDITKIMKYLSKELTSPVPEKIVCPNCESDNLIHHPQRPMRREWWSCQCGCTFDMWGGSPTVSGDWPLKD